MSPIGPLDPIGPHPNAPQRSSLESSSLIVHRSSLPQMPVPDRYRSAFSSSTLKTIETHAARFRVSDPLFFRAAYTADVTESERRTFRSEERRVGKEGMHRGWR